MKLLCTILTFISICIFSQEGFMMVNKEEKTTIPFQLINNLIFITVNVNGVDLTFLLDTGVSDTILFSLENKQGSFKEVEKIQFAGLGSNMQVDGYKSINNIVKIGKNYIDPAHKIYLILDERMNFSSHIGIPVNGIIGYEFFKNYQVEIDYNKKKIFILKPNFNKNKTKKFEKFSITIEGNKPYLQTDVEIKNQLSPAKLLLDIGSSDAVWLFPSYFPDFEYTKHQIDDYLGQGFTGDIYGKRGRIHRLHIGKFALDKPIVSMPDADALQHLQMVENRKGSIGSEVMKRFNVILDYQNNLLYLKKNKFYSEIFSLNKSGLEIIHNGVLWEKDILKVEIKNKDSNKNMNPDIAKRFSDNNQELQYTFALKPQYAIAGCRKESPCSEVGIKKDDKLISIDGKNASNLTLEKINEIMRQKDGKNIELILSREKEILKFRLTLVDPIPYEE